MTLPGVENKTVYPTAEVIQMSCITKRTPLVMDRTYGILVKGHM